jgi:hypothetical protein
MRGLARRARCIGRRRMPKDASHWRVDVPNKMKYSMRCLS